MKPVAQVIATLGVKITCCRDSDFCCPAIAWYTWTVTGSILEGRGWAVQPTYR